MSNGLITLYSMDRVRLWGRDEFATELFAEFNGGCTIFGIEGVTGAGKTEFLFQFSRRLQDGRGPDPIIIRAGDAPTEALLIASLYKALTEVPIQAEQRFEQSARSFLAKVPSAARLLAGALIKDMAKAAKLEKTVEQFADLVAGKEADNDPYSTLLDIGRDNQRMLFAKALEFVTDLGNPVCLIIDDYELLDASAESFLRSLIRSKPESCVIFLAINTEKPSSSNWQGVMARSISAEQGCVRSMPELSKDELAAWYEAATGSKPNSAELAELIRGSSGGRPKFVELMLKARCSQGAQPRALNVTNVVRGMRAGLSDGARLVGELLALLPGDASVPIDLLAAAVRPKGVVLGSALDEIAGSGLIDVSAGRVRFRHSSYAGEWQGDLDSFRERELVNLWYDAFVAVGFASPDYATSGLVPLLAERISSELSADEVGGLAAELKNMGALEDSLLLLDKAWRGDTDREDGDA